MLIVTTFALAACQTEGGDEPPIEPLPREVSTSAFFQIDGQRITPDLKVEISDDEERRRQGLMYRQELPNLSGMLFIWEKSAPRSFWMKNTPLPLDMIFLNQGQIVGVIENAQPFDETHLHIGRIDADAVLEMNAGFVQKYNLNAGGFLKFIDTEGEDGESVDDEAMPPAVDGI